MRWASSHNYTFTFAVIAGKDEAWIHHAQYYEFVDDYVNSAPVVANVAATKPRMHGAPAAKSPYIVDAATFEACAEGDCQIGLFRKQYSKTDPEYVGHFDDMNSGARTNYQHAQYEYTPSLISDDKRVAYTSKKYPWLLAVYRYHNMINIEVPMVPGKGQHYIVHYSSRSTEELARHTCGPGPCYNDAIDVHALPTQVPEELIYGRTTGRFDWVDHCQFVDPAGIVSPVRNATDNAAACRADMDTKDNLPSSTRLGINVVPSENPDVVPATVVRAEESVPAVCAHACATDTAGQCRAPTATPNTALCQPPARVWPVAWANPAISKKSYDRLSGARVGDYIEWAWDDVFHDLWLMDTDAAASSCDFSQATRLVKPLHHSYDATAGGRVLYRLPANASKKTLHFACNVATHCKAGQLLSVTVGAAPDEDDEPDTSIKTRICADGYVQCSGLGPFP